MKKLIVFLAVFSAIQSQAQILKKISDKAKEKIDKAVDEKVNGKPTGENKSITASGVVPGRTEEKSIRTYSKYDFVPGEKIVVFEDFMQDKIGDFPDKWNTNSAGETVTLDGQQGHWFMMTKPGVFMPEYIDGLPEDFTLEYDIMSDRPVVSWGFSTVLAELANREKPEDWRSSPNLFHLNILPGASGNGSTQYDRRKMGEGEAATSAELNVDLSRPVHIAFWRQKERLRVYINQNKAWDVPKAFAPGAKLNALLFHIQLTDKWNFLVSNIRLGVGAPDTRNKILKQNKWVTHGIMFDVNSATIKPESYGSMKEIADILKEYADIKLRIVGHTDADGNDAANLELSRRRAAAVREALAKEFAIDENRMETDGKGETEPMDKNDTPAAKANNRRVEFIKI